MPRLPLPGTTTEGLGLGALRDDLRETVSTLRQGAGDVLSARALGETFRGLGLGSGDSSPDSSLFKGVGDLLGGLTSAFKGTSELQQTMLGTLMASLKTGGGGDNMMLLMFLLMQMNNQQIEQLRRDAEARLDQEREHWRTRYDELQQRSGPGMADQTVHSLTTSLLTDAVAQLRQPPPDPAEQLAGAVERLKKAGASLPGLFGGGQPLEYSEGALKLKGLHNEELRYTYEHQAALEEARANRAWAQALVTNGPAMIREAAAGIIQTMAGFGLIPGLQVAYVPPAQNGGGGQPAAAEAGGAVQQLPPPGATPEAAAVARARRDRIRAQLAAAGGEGQ